MAANLLVNRTAVGFGRPGSKVKAIATSSPELCQYLGLLLWFVLTLSMQLVL